MRIVAILGLVLMAGCGTGLPRGTNTAGGVTLAEARVTCHAWDPFADADIDSLVLVAEARRDAGEVEASFIHTILPVCSNDADPTGCRACFTQIGAAVWN